jgi:hypothetical protein
MQVVSFIMAEPIPNQVRQLTICKCINYVIYFALPLQFTLEYVPPVIQPEMVSGKGMVTNDDLGKEIC